VEGTLAHLLTLGVEFDFLDATSVERGDVAFVSGAWTERGIGPDGAYEFETRTSDMLRRQADGTWKFLVTTLARVVRP
jgi:ketosteroid isomerase-like protein